MKAEQIIKDVTLQRFITTKKPEYIYFKMPKGAEYAGTDLEFAFTKPNGKIYSIYM